MKHLRPIKINHDKFARTCFFFHQWGTTRVGEISVTSAIVEGHEGEIHLIADYFIDKFMDTNAEDLIKFWKEIDRYKKTDECVKENSQ